MVIWAWPSLVVAAPALGGVVGGVLLEKGTRAPTPGVQITLTSAALASPREAFTDADGRFEFEGVPAGAITLEIDEPPYRPSRYTGQLAEGASLTVTRYLERAGFSGEITVLGQRRPPRATRRGLDAAELRSLPGTQGDPLRALQGLPGVARATYRDELVLRGGGLAQPLLDDHPIPQAFHFGGVRSTVSAGLIEQLDVHPGVYAPKYGRANGGVVAISLRRPAIDDHHGYVELDIFDAGALIEGPVGSGWAPGWSFAISGRRSYIDAVVVTALPRDLRRVFRTAPRYYDGVAALEGRVGRHTLKASVYGSSDRLRLLFSEGESADEGRYDLQQEWLGGRLEWSTRLTAAVRRSTSAAYVATWARFEQDFGLIDPIRVRQTHHLVTARDETEIRIAEGLRLAVGADSTLGVVTSEGRLPPPAGEGLGAEIPESAFIDFRGRVTALSPAVYLDLTSTLGALTLNLGGRIDYFSASEEAAAQPRLTARYALLPETILRAGVGLFVEPPRPEEITEGVGNPALSAEGSAQISLGVAQQLASGLSLDVTGFYKALYDLVVVVEAPETRYRNQGEGRVYGLELLLRQQATERLYGWLAYTLMRAERRDAPGEPYRPFELDQTHNLAAVARYRLTPRWSLGLRWRYGTGDPVTPAAGASYDADTGAFVPVSGPLFSERLGPFHQLDLRVDRTWLFDTWRLSAWFELVNAYNRRSPEARAYSYDYSESSVFHGLPIVPSVGARGAF